MDLSIWTFLMAIATFVVVFWLFLLAWLGWQCKQKRRKDKDEKVSGNIC